MIIFTTLRYFPDTLQILIEIMEKLDRHVFEAITQLRSNKKQSNESIVILIVILTSEKLEEPNIDKKQLTEGLKWLVEYKKPENNPRNEVNLYHNISDEPVYRTTPCT